MSAKLRSEKVGCWGCGEDGSERSVGSAEARGSGGNGIFEKKVWTVVRSGLSGGRQAAIIPVAISMLVSWSEYKCIKTMDHERLEKEAGSEVQAKDRV